MMFEEVDFISLVPTQKYKIKWGDIEYKGTFYLHNTVSDGIFSVFTDVQYKETSLPYLFIKVYPDKQADILRPIFQAQQAMEQRFLHLILRDTLGDPYFMWYIDINNCSLR